MVEAARAAGIVRACASGATRRRGVAKLVGAAINRATSTHAQAKLEAKAVHEVDDRLHAVREEIRERHKRSVGVPRRVPAVVQDDPLVSNGCHPVVDHRLGRRADLVVETVVRAARASGAPRLPAQRGLLCHAVVVG